MHKIEVTPEKKTILVTGGAGYIGAHACKALAAEGYTPVVVDNLSTGHPGGGQVGAAGGGRHRGRAVPGPGLCAAPADGGDAFRGLRAGRGIDDGPGEVLPEQRGGDAGADRGDGAARGQADGVFLVVRDVRPAALGPDDGGEPQQPINPYGRTKLMVENLLKDFEASHGIRHVALRYFNAAGADPEGEIGEDHDPETHLIPIMLDAALGRQRSVTIFGEDYPTPDGTCIRDYVHVADLAQAHVLALKHLGGCGASLQVNLGNGQGYSVRQVLKVAENITGIPIDFKVGERREGTRRGWWPTRSGRRRRWAGSRSTRR
jgi:UDP-arabinose 4-epimerase